MCILQDVSGEQYRAIMILLFVNIVFVVYTCAFSLLKVMNCSNYVRFNKPLIALNYCIFPSPSITNVQG